MTEAFYAILKASFQGSIVILAVMALRLLLKKAPKSLFCLLWLLVGLRLALPFEIQSSLSLQPDYSFSTEAAGAREEIMNKNGPVLVGQEQATPSVQIPSLPEGNREDKQTGHLLYGAQDGTVSEPIRYGDIAAGVWILGLAAMLAASAVSYFRLKRRVREAYLIENGCFECPGLDTAFVLGFFPPKIYLPMGLSDREKKFIFDHENTHIARHDQWYKLLGYAVLALHWFNPLVWVAYHLLCRDMELACDEHVVKYMSLPERKAYSAALLSCGSHTSRIAACPVAFGESNPKRRIMNVLNYKRPSFWICLLAVIAVIFVSVCLLTSPEVKEEAPEDELTWNLELKATNVTPSGLTVEFIQHGDFPDRGRATLQFGTYYTLERLENGQWVDVEMLPQEYDVAWTMEAYMIDIGKTATRRENWEWLYGQLPAGHYRIGKDVDLFRMAGDWDSEMFYAEFDIVEQSASDEKLITQCREAMMELKNSEALDLYLENLNDPTAAYNIYMKTPGGWLFRYRRPLWDYEYVSWLRYGDEQYLYSGDMDDDGIMTMPYYWQVEQNPESHTFQLPYPFDLDWEKIDLILREEKIDGAQRTITLEFPDYLDVFTFHFSYRELSWFDVGDSSGEPEATTTRCYVLSTDAEEVEEDLSALYREAASTAGQKPGTPDDAFYNELFNRITDGMYTTQWIYDLYGAFYLDPAGFVSRLSVHDRAEEILMFMNREVDYHAPYRFARTLAELEESQNPNAEIIEKMKAFTGLTGQIQQQETDELGDQIAWLAKCATALEEYQSQGTWAIKTENSFQGEGTLNSSSASLWYGCGKDYLNWAQIPDDGGAAVWWDLQVDGASYHCNGYFLKDGSEDWMSQWEEGSTNSQQVSPPWPLWYDWKGSDIEFVEQGTEDSADYVTFTVQGGPFPAHTSDIGEYRVTFWFRYDVLHFIELSYSKTDSWGEATDTRKVFDLYFLAPKDVEIKINQCHSEALLHVHGICNDPDCTDTTHDHYGISCTVEHCTNPAHGHGDEHHD